MALSSGSSSVGSLPDAAPEMEILERVTDILLGSRFSIDTLLLEIARVATEQLGVQGCAIRLVDQNTGHLVLESSYGLSSAFESGSGTIVKESELYQLLSGGDEVRLLDIEDHSDIYAREHSDAGAPRSALIGGMFRKARLLGTVAVFTAERHEFTPLERRALKILARQTALALEVARLHHEEDEAVRLQREVAVASDFQSRMLPRQVPTLEGVELAAWYKPWHEVGGDFYDFIPLPDDSLGIALGDVSGKGVPAGLLMSAVRAALRLQAESLLWLPEAFRRLNQTIFGLSEPGQFTTLFYGIYSVGSGKLSYVNAGHVPPGLFRTKEAALLEAGGLPIGVMPDATYELETVQLDEGDVLAIYTDGFTDVECKGERVFGDKRLRKLLRRTREQSPNEIIDAINEALQKAECQGDDRAIIIMKVGEVPPKNGRS